MDASSASAALPILPIIMAGGAGARLAPISSPLRPKPFVPLAAGGPSLLQLTCERVRHHHAFMPPLLIGQVADRFALLNHSRAAGCKPRAILLESCIKNTAAAVAVASAWAVQHYGEAQILAILPADHIIEPVAAWQTQLVRLAEACAQQQALGLMGTVARQPNPAYGYVLAGKGDIAPVRQFVEKPACPEPLVARGAYWNMGQFVGRAGDIVAAMDVHAPAYARAAQHVLAASQQDWEFTRLGMWDDALPPEPFDRAVIEKMHCISAVYDGFWQDLGTLQVWQEATGLHAESYAALPPRTDRPWGYFEELERWEGGCRKRLVLFPGCRISLQRHHHRSEQWTVEQGIAHVEREDARIVLHSGEQVTIPALAWHRLENKQNDMLIIQEEQIGMASEADIERRADDYTRI